MQRTATFAGSNGKTDMGDSDGRFVWYELATTDIEAAEAFYASVVGWGTRDASMPGSDYSLFTAGDTPVAGLTNLPADARRAGVAPQWRGYVGVGDVDVAVSRVNQLGGTVHVPPANVRNVSRMSVIADPEMATLALIEARERGGERYKLDKPRHVGWHELLAADVERAFAFYNGLLGWQKTHADASSMGTYQQFSAGAEAIGGVFTKPETSPLSLWLYYFNVGDIGAAAKRVETGGGEILYGPATAPGGAQIVHCTDPQGAIFALVDKRVHVAVGCYSPRDPSNTPARL